MSETMTNDKMPDEIYVCENKKMYDGSKVLPAYHGRIGNGIRDYDETLYIRADLAETRVAHVAHMADFYKERFLRLSESLFNQAVLQQNLAEKIFEKDQALPKKIEGLEQAIKNMHATFDWHGELADRAKVIEAARAYLKLTGDVPETKERYGRPVFLQEIYAEMEKKDEALRVAVGTLKTVKHSIPWSMGNCEGLTEKVDKAIAQIEAMIGEVE